jgi:hypothetical protein
MGNSGLPFLLDPFMKDYFTEYSGDTSSGKTRENALLSFGPFLSFSEQTSDQENKSGNDQNENYPADSSIAVSDIEEEVSGDVMRGKVVDIGTQEILRRKELSCVFIGKECVST